MKKPISTPRNAAEYEALDKRAGELVGCCENSAEEAELEGNRRCAGFLRHNGPASAASRIVPNVRGSLYAMPLGRISDP